MIRKSVVKIDRFFHVSKGSIPGFWRDYREFFYLKVYFRRCWVYTNVVEFCKNYSMIKKTIEGVDYYCFESSDSEVRKEFEKSMIGEDMVKNLVKALLDASIEAQLNKLKAWEQIQEILVSQYSELDDIEDLNLSYKWLMGGFTLEK